MPAPDAETRKPRFSYWRGYPARYREIFVDEGKRAAVAVALLLLLPLGGAIAWFAGSAWLPLRVVFGLLLLGIAGFGGFICYRTLRALLVPRVVPYFEKSLGEPEPFSGGDALAKNSEHLDELAAAAGANPLSSFGFVDDFYGEPMKWHEPALAVATIKAITPQVSAAEAALRRDLEALSEFLGRAASRKTRFALVIRTVHAVSDAEKQRRQGFFK
ncbi:MAG: hypothetical protein M3020_11250 [Myxococcota bacterium]|jgi:hypothetical protein|nr:hypothetical protein [Myxococcota bacterium]